MQTLLTDGRSAASRPPQNLAGNEIEKIENVGLLNSLECLQLEGNAISNLDEVQNLSKLPNLRTLSFKLPDSELRNPVCEHPGYYTAVRRMLPKLTSLDGERTVLHDAGAPEGNPLDNIVLPTPAPWLKDFSWDSGMPPSGEPLGGTQVKPPHTARATSVRALGRITQPPSLLAGAAFGGSCSL